MTVNKCLLEKQQACDKIIYVKFLVKSLLFCFLKKKKDGLLGFCIIYVWELGDKKKVSRYNKLKTMVSFSV